jgi:hypothetical protein
MGVLKWLFKGAIVALLRSDSATIGVQHKKFGTVKGALWEGGALLVDSSRGFADGKNA